MSTPRGPRAISFDTDRGQVTAFTAMIVVALFAVAGLVIDGGYALAARQRAANIAEQAARVGADQLEANSLRSGHGWINPAAARAAALAYLARVGHSGAVSADGATVTVTVSATQPTAFLGLVGIDELNVRGYASARAIGGIVVEEADVAEEIGG